MFRPCTGCPPSNGRNNSTRRELFLIQFCDRIDRSHFSKRSSQFLTSLTSLQCVYLSHRISNVFGNVRVIHSFFFSPLLFFFSEKDLLFSVKMTRCNWRRRTKRNTRYISVTNAFPVITNNLSGTVYGASKLCVCVCVCECVTPAYRQRTLFRPKLAEWKRARAFPWRQFRRNATVEVSSRHLQCNNWTPGTITG